MHKQSHDHWLKLMSDSKYCHFESDTYNEGPLVDELETRVAALLGKPDAMFFNRGTTCQMAALKVHCDNQNNPKVMLHPQSHIAQDEQDAFQALMGLEGVFIGNPDQPLTLEDVQASDEQVAVLVIELPLRRAGFKLAQWQDLLELRKWCDEHQVIMHMDGARLWESAHHYGHAWAGISRLFDSVYVSMYKGIGALTGALLAGKNDFLEQCQVWRDRLGSNMWSAFPALITALHGLDHNLNQINQWVIRAKDIATALQRVDGLIIEKPQTNGFQIRIKADLYPTNNKLKSLTNQLGINPCKPFAKVVDSNLLFTEIQVGACHNDIKTFELVEFFQALVNSK